MYYCPLHTHICMPYRPVYTHSRFQRLKNYFVKKIRLMVIIIIIWFFFFYINTFLLFIKHISRPPNIILIIKQIKTFFIVPTGSFNQARHYPNGILSLGSSSKLNLISIKNSFIFIFESRIQHEFNSFVWFISYYSSATYGLKLLSWESLDIQA